MIIKYYIVRLIQTRESSKYWYAVWGMAYVYCQNEGL